MTISLRSIRTKVAKSPEAGAIASFLSVFLFFSLATPETFLSNSSLSSILNSQAVPGIMAIGITLLMISGEFDLSVGSILGVSSLAFLYTAVNGVHILLAMFFGIASGCLLGLVNGLLLVWTGIPSFIVTLGTMLVFRAISLTAISGGRIIRYADYFRQPPTIDISFWFLLLCTMSFLALIFWMSFPMIARAFNKKRGTSGKSRLSRSLILLAGAGIAIFGCLKFLGSVFPGDSQLVRLSFFDLLNGRLEFPYIGDDYRISIIWWITLSIVFSVILTRTRFGNGVYATGGNAEAARLQGIRTKRIRIVNFVLSGGLASLAGIIQVARLKSVDPLRGEGMELEVIASVVIGGTLLTGGFGSILGSAIGTALTGMLRTGLVLTQVPSNAFRGAIGAIMIGAVIINSLVRKTDDS